MIQIMFDTVGSNVPRLVFLLLIVAQSTVVSSTICRSSLQCHDGDPQTIDLCWIARSKCLNIARSNGTNQKFVLRTLTSLYKETNRIPLSLSRKRRIVSTAAEIMREVNPHRFLQIKVLKVDIVQKLGEFLSSLNYKSKTSTPSNFYFHGKMRSIFQKMNDRHSVYKPPSPLLLSWAALLFNVKEFYGKSGDQNQGKPVMRYVVADVAVGYKFAHPAFGKGVEILKWNGKRVNEVVLRLGQHSYGSNRDAQISNGISLLTIRHLALNKVPSKLFANMVFQELNGSTHAIKIPWTFFTKNDQSRSRTMTLRAPFSKNRLMPVRRKGKVRGNSNAVGHEFQEIAAGYNLVRLPESNRKRVQVVVKFEDVSAAEIVSTLSGPIGLLTLPSFHLYPMAEAMTEISRVLRLMPPDELVVDFRNNMGGHPDSVRALSELISDVEISDQPLSIRASDLTSKLSREASRRHSGGQGRCYTCSLSCTAAIENARKVGEPFTGPIGNLYSSSGRLARVYSGPVVTVINGLTYSAGDIFSAVQVDQNVSLLVGTSNNVGAGGAITRSYSSLAKSFPSTLQPLPGGVDFRTSFCRYYRTGTQSGELMEYYGIKPQIRYYPTLNDATNDDHDLLEFLGKTLASRLP